MEYETRDIKDYGRSLKLFDDLNGVEGVFPESIPADAGDVSFNCYNNPGGKHLLISFIADAESVKTVLSCTKSECLSRKSPILWYNMSVKS